MFKIGQRFSYCGNKCTVHLLNKEKTTALIKYDNTAWGHGGSTSKYHYDDNGNKVDFIAPINSGFYYVNYTHINHDLIPIINENIIDYEVY